MGKRPVFEKKTFGAQGESLAAQFLKKHKLTVLDRNFRTLWGELDLIAKEKDTLVFVEVKTRQTDKAGYPEEAIKKWKVRHLIRAAWLYTQKHPDLPSRWRLDVIAIRYSGGQPEICWYQNISPLFS